MTSDASQLLKDRLRRYQHPTMDDAIRYIDFLEGVLGKIAASRTSHANATVRRICRIAEESLKHPEISR